MVLIYKNWILISMLMYGYEKKFIIIIKIDWYLKKLCNY